MSPGPIMIVAVDSSAIIAMFFDLLLSENGGAEQEGYARLLEKG
jgi:hypothetical protein